MTAYYNEIDPYAAQWLANLIEAGHIAPGVVDTRSIEDVRPADLAGFTQCHFFAGIGVWSYALRRAGWPDDRPCWTGSCPCQPFSAAGKGAGFDDERHLWPAWHYLIEQCRPPIVFGEQVASKDAGPWVDLVHTDMETLGYAFGTVPFPAASVGAPHIRDRLYWVADCTGQRLPSGARESGVRYNPRQLERPGVPCGLGDAQCIRPGRDARASIGTQSGSTLRSVGDDSGSPSATCGLGFSPSGRCNRLGDQPTHCEPVQANTLGGHWASAEWIWCRDGKYRPVEPVPLKVVDGVAESMGRLCSGTIEAFAEEMNGWALRHQTDPGEALQHVWCSLSAQALRQRAVGRHRGVSQPPILLAFLRQLQKQGWAVAQGLPRAGEKAPTTGMRMLWGDSEAASASLRRGLDEQHAGEPADPMHVLSSLLARHAQAAWGEAFDAHAAATFPLAHGAPARVGRLRAYGNAIVATQAEEFIRAVIG